MHDERPRVLIVDDEKFIRDILADFLGMEGDVVRTAEDGAAALTELTAAPYDMVISDLKMPRMGGIELLDAIATTAPNALTVIMTGFGSIATAVEAMRLGATSYVQKPADADDILTAFMRAELPPQQAVPADTPPPTLARVEWEHIQRVLADCEGNISQAAKLLGLHRRSLQRKLSKRPPRV